MAVIGNPWWGQKLAIVCDWQRSLKEAVKNVLWWSLKLAVSGGSWWLMKVVLVVVGFGH